MSEVEVKIVARTPEIGALVEACARGDLAFCDLCAQVAKMGYKTTSLFEMVRAAEEEEERAGARSRAR